MDIVRFGIIGCGYQTTKNMAPAMQKCDCSIITACYDLDIPKAEQVSQSYNARSYGNLDELLSSEEIDAVYIATPISTHADLCKKAADAGKHILCEKSLAMNPTEAREIREYTELRKVFLMEGLMYQFHTQHQFVRDMVSKGEIGEPRVFFACFGFPPFPQTDFRMRKDRGGGALLDAGAYVIHSAKSFFGKEPINEHRVISYDDSGLDMHGSILMDFGEKQTAHLIYGMDNSYKNSYSVWGTEGEIILLRAFSIPEHQIPVCRIINQGLVREFQLKPCNHFIEELKEFASKLHR